MPTLTLKIISTQHEEKLSFETASRNNRDIWKIYERYSHDFVYSKSFEFYNRFSKKYFTLSLPSSFVLPVWKFLNRLKFEKIGCNKLKRGTSVSKIIGRATKDQRITFPRNLILERAW